MASSHLMRGRIIIWLSFLIALTLQATPWPGTLEVLRPSWIILVTFYWVLALPHRVNVGTAMLLGILWDLLLGTTLGIRGMTMAILVYLVAANFKVLRNLALWQQAAIFSGLTLLGKILEFMGEFLVRDVAFNAHFLWAGVLNFILWPWLFLLMRRVRRHWSIR
ncbi:rod shape-determining protein MreD [Aliivibrio sp. S3MY1]|uniref:rod shape-determining protein MreD n=1 Tax=unclassified Aliivibrio TaxID=2645654 RepID=UPI002379A635|nr:MULTISPECIES: rod shape-determining protein MreD [unclassified Aliivibrio]MDD9197078.1 rod shape-determining protein MreD [Aliivibrio sp. S3MY1]MDD9200202.1 rod shape-determining protein MreD [Aliivibrio sp. S2MY1]